MARRSWRNPTSTYRVARGSTIVFRARSFPSSSSPHASTGKQRAAIINHCGSRFGSKNREPDIAWEHRPCTESRCSSNEVRRERFSVTEQDLPEAVQRSLRVFPRGLQWRIQSPPRTLHGHQPGRGMRGRGYDRRHLSRFFHRLGFGARGTRATRGDRGGNASGDARRELRLRERELPGARGRDLQAQPRLRAAALLRIRHRGHHVLPATRAGRYGTAQDSQVRGCLSRRQRGRGYEPVPTPPPGFPPARSLERRYSTSGGRRHPRRSLQRQHPRGEDCRRACRRSRGRHCRALAAVHPPERGLPREPACPPAPSTTYC